MTAKATLTDQCPGQAHDSGALSPGLVFSRTWYVQKADTRIKMDHTDGP